jgi:uncharacterized protein (DUF433 family)
MHRIIDRGRGPEIDGTRITVYDILDYSEQGWHHTAIAAALHLSSDEVLTALRYIEEHREEVMANYRAILERCAWRSIPSAAPGGFTCPEQAGLTVPAPTDRQGVQTQDRTISPRV